MEESCYIHHLGLAYKINLSTWLLRLDSICWTSPLTSHWFLLLLTLTDWFQLAFTRQYRTQIWGASSFWFLFFLLLFHNHKFRWRSAPWWWRWWGRGRRGWRWGWDHGRGRGRRWNTDWGNRWWSGIYSVLCHASPSRSVNCYWHRIHSILRFSRPWLGFTFPTVLTRWLLGSVCYSDSFLRVCQWPAWFFDKSFITDWQGWGRVLGRVLFLTRGLISWRFYCLRCREFLKKKKKCILNSKWLPLIFNCIYTDIKYQYLNILHC